jgi:hypothetical protein
MADDIRRISRLWLVTEPEEDPKDEIRIRRLQLLTFLEHCDDFPPLIREKIDHLVDNFFDEMIAYTPELIFNDGIGDEYHGLDDERDTQEELEATLRFFPCVMYMPRLTADKMSLLVFL